MNSCGMEEQVWSSWPKSEIWVHSQIYCIRKTKIVWDLNVVTVKRWWCKMVGSIWFIMERERRFYNWRIWVFPGHFIIKLPFIQLLVMSQGFCLFTSNVPDWTFRGHVFLLVLWNQRNRILYFLGCCLHEYETINEVV